MNKLNWNEREMLSWRPRRVSSGLEGKIFAAEPRETHPVRWFWGALVPATACALLTLMTVNQGGDSFGADPQMGMALSSLSYFPLAPEDRQSAQNHNDFVTFDSTNKSVFNSNVGFTFATNYSNE